MTKAQEFIARHSMDYRDIVLDEQVGTYIDEMEKGLSGNNSSLLMIPTYMSLADSVRLGENVICIDAGGTNFRIGVAHFDENGKYVLEEMKKLLMPGVERQLTAKEFFRAFADIIEPYLCYAKKVAISFAYRTISTPDVDNEIIVITKEVKVTGVEGKLLGKEIKAELAGMGHDDVDIIVINDAVASALAGKAEKMKEGYGAFTGTILGTGCNSCYIEDNGNITKVDVPAGKMAVNLEAGSYGRFPRTDIDMAYDATTIHPGLGIAEKMASGAYLGGLCGFALYRAAEEGVFETKAIEEAVKMRSEDVSEYLEQGSGIVAEYMINSDDEENARLILRNIVLRAARVVAVQMAAIAEKSFRTNNRICMSVEGSVYEKMDGLRGELHRALLEYLGGRGIEADLITIDMAVMKGCAIAGLSR